jgi:hypothetical protein
MQSSVLVGNFNHDIMLSFQLTVTLRVFDLGWWITSPEMDCYEVKKK